MTKRKSIRAAISMLLLSIMMLMMAFLIIFTFNLQKLREDQSIESAKLTLQVAGAELSSDMAVAEEFLDRTSTTNDVLANLGSEDDMTRTYAASEEISKVFTPILSANKCISCIAAYDTKTGVYHVAYGELGGSTGAERVQLKSNIQSTMRKKVADDTLPLNGWQIDAVGDRYFLWRATYWRNVYCICMIDLTQTTSLLTKEYNLEGQFVITRSGTLLTPLDIDIGGHEWGEKQVTWTPSKSPVLIVEASQNGFDLCVVINHSEIASNVSAIQFMLIALCLLVLFFVGFAFFYLRRNFILPMNSLMLTMESITAGDLTASTCAAQTSEEFQKLNDTFKSMIATITKMKIDAYEQDIEAQKLKLQTLKMQIRPHFYLNCLKSIYAFAALGKNTEVQDKILYLSRHLRYVFTELEDTVTMKQELELCQNYIAMLNIGNDKKISLLMDIEPELAELMIPSVSLLSLVENSAKYMPIGREKLEIRITAHTLKLGDKQLINLAIKDDGDGFSPETLSMLKNPSPEHIGISNIVRRFQACFGKECAVAFYNNFGAQVDFFIPDEREA